MAILELKNIVKSFDDVNIVDNISLSIGTREFFTILGPSGCGKTTLLKMIAGLEYPDSGQILLDGKDITKLPPEKRPLHTIFQSYALFPHMTVRKNIEFPLKMAKWDKSKIDAQVDELVEDVKLTKFVNRYPHELSGGQKQRVAIARALADRPKILLLDEPLSALDASLREHMHIELVKIQEETETTFIYVTHDQKEALALSSRIAVMNQGEIEQLGTPSEIYSHPKTYFVSDFIGKCNLLDAKVIAKDADVTTLMVADYFEVKIKHQDADVGTQGWFVVRPEKIKAHKIHNIEHHDGPHKTVFKAVVKGYYYYGDTTLYEFILPNNKIIQCLLPNNRVHEVEFFSDNKEVYVLIEHNAGSFLTK